MFEITLDKIKKELNNNFDVQYRQILWGSKIITLVYIESLCDAKYITDAIIAPLMKVENPSISVIQLIKDTIILTTSVEEVKSLENAINKVLSANILILLSDSDTLLCCDARGYETRAIEVPIAETVIKGPREGFTEDININISAIRRRIKTPDLKIEKFTMGKKSQTALALLYIEGETPNKLIEYIKEKIQLVNQGSYIFYSNKLEEALSCKGTSFDTVGYTEKPDIAVSKLSEGRVLIMMDGSGFVTTAPYFFIENFQTTDDYTLNKHVANTARLFRYVAFIISVFSPGLYLALVTHNIKLIPSIFLFRMAVYRAGVPVPTVIELLYMLIFFQIIREAGVRLPQPIGPTLSIVGALILGDAAVNSGLASQVTVVVVAIASISSYLIPKIYISIFKWNLLIIGFTFFLGLPGFYTAFVIFTVHLADLSTCGYPFLYPMGTYKYLNYKDVIFRGQATQMSENIFNRKENK